MNKTKKMINIMISILIISIVTILPNNGVDMKANEIPKNSFSVRALLPNNQQNKNVSYFDLRMNPNQNQILEIELSNNSEERIEISTTLNSATTGNNGSIIYSKQGEKDRSLKQSINDLATVTTPVISLEKNEKKSSFIELKMLNVTFDGDILGGITLKEINSEDKEGSQTENIQIKNEIAYIIALKLNMTDTSLQTNLNLINKEGTTINYRTSFVANIQNDKSVLMKNVNILGNIKNKDSNEYITTLDLKDKEIAPNSNFNVVYDLNNKKMKNGTYIMYLKIEHLNEVWEWTEEIVVNNADEINETALSVESDNTIIIIIIAFSSVIILLLLIIILLIVKRRKKEKENNQNENYNSNDDNNNDII